MLLPLLLPFLSPTSGVRSVGVTGGRSSRLGMALWCGVVSWVESGGGASIGLGHIHEITSITSIVRPRTNGIPSYVQKGAGFNQSNRAGTPKKTSKSPVDRNKGCEHVTHRTAIESNQSGSSCTYNGACAVLAVGAASLLGVSGDARRGVTGFHDHHILCGWRPECIARGWTGHSHRWKRGGRRRTARTVAWPLFPDDVGIKGLGVWGVAGRVGALVGYAASRHPFLRATPPPRPSLAPSKQAFGHERPARHPRGAHRACCFFSSSPPHAPRPADRSMGGWTSVVGRPGTAISVVGAPWLGGWLHEPSA